MQCVPKRMHRITVTSRNRIWCRSCISDEWLDEIRSRQPEFRDSETGNVTKKNIDIPEYDAQIITSYKKMADIFEATTAICNKPKKVSNWLMVETHASLKRAEYGAGEISGFLREILQSSSSLADAGTINSTVAKEVFEDSV